MWLLALELGGRVMGALGGILAAGCSLIGGSVMMRRSGGPSSFRAESMLGGPGEKGTERAGGPIIWPGCMGGMGCGWENREGS